MMSPLPNAKTRMVPVKEVSSYFRQALLRPLLASLAEIPPPEVDESLRNHHFGGGSPCDVCLLHLERGGVNRKVTVTATSCKERRALYLDPGEIWGKTFKHEPRKCISTALKQ